MNQGQRLIACLLTVIAVLLAGILWVQIADRPLLADRALAQSRTRYVNPPTIPNAAKQRERTIEALRTIQSTLDASARLLQSGQLEVTVTNLDQIEWPEP